MMAFMVVSAVAFSMFMRQSRLPSSFLRQRVTASQLAKAGLANAMRELDESIGNDPYPGVRNGAGNGVNNGNSGTDRNYWKNRIFMGDNAAASQGEGEEESDMDTVSTLTLEGLAYVPPPLINTVRYWSHRTPTAAWKALGYDAGRYAYVAVNVSDYFDFNRVRANVMRDSSPANRISMGYLFENEAHSGPGTVSPAAFEQFVSATTNDAFRTRLVSMADYNLAVDSGKYGDPGFTSPFCEYIRSPKKDGSFYGSGAADAKRQKFVTDSWFPPVATNAVLLTDDVNGQPFDGKDQSLDELQKMSGSDAYKIVRERVDICSLGALYDYVDDDNVPISLAIPTVEHAPMLTGLRLTPSGFNVKLDCKESPPTVVGTSAGGSSVQQVRRAWWLDSLGNDPKVVFSACLAYPFARSSNVSRPSSYEVQVLVRAFFSPEDIARTRLDTKGLKPGKGDWKKDNGLMAQDKAYLTLFGSQKVRVSEGTDEQHCVLDCSGIELSFDTSAIKDTWVYGLTYQEDDEGKIVTPHAYDASPENLALSPSGKKLIYRDLAKGNGVDVADNLKLKLNFIVWVRVLDGDNTVDLVPAMLSDDLTYNGHNSGDMGGDAKKVCGETEPVIPLSSVTEVFDLNLTPFQNAGANAIQTTPQMGDLAILCDDPRFNYAPEDWYRVEDGNISPTRWLEAAKTRCNGAEHRPNDIFQFVSDEGYLQSMGELQYLPYLEPFGDGAGGVPNGGFYNAGKYSGQPFDSRKSAGACANSAYAWKTHWAFGTQADAHDGTDADPYNWGILDSNGGMKVSPYADEDLMMAAIANTPYDWIVASENDKMDLAAGRKYCFGPSSSEAKVEWEQLKTVARGIKAAIGANPDWETQYRNANGWDQDNLFGADMGDLHDVDRKYLYSYWKNCFGNEQQLFLIFVRAEPTVMGGSSAGHTPSQLGARAVALVWREPKSSVRSSTGTVGVHRMRILFYHQFEQ